jgi:hypothetical protein
VPPLPPAATPALPPSLDGKAAVLLPQPAPSAGNPNTGNANPSVVK